MTYCTFQVRQPKIFYNTLVSFSAWIRDLAGYRHMHKRSSTSSQIYTGAYITSISKAMLKAARKEVEKSAKSAEVRENLTEQCREFTGSETHSMFGQEQTWLLLQGTFTFWW